jgi:hypothetical protein
MNMEIWSMYVTDPRPHILWKGEATHVPRNGDLIDIDDETREVCFVAWQPQTNTIKVRVK